MVLDFTSSLYLGLRHASINLRPWAQLTTGVPAALETPPLARTVGGGLAELVGVERSTLSRSTLHAFWDLFLIIGEADTAIYMDINAYPIARWGVERAACRGVPLRTFKHRDPHDLWRRLTRDARRRPRPLIVADGFCTGCGRFAPLHDYLAMARELGGTVVLDDTQALGIFGDSPTAAMPYGAGGGGTLHAQALVGAPVILVSSLTKGFGVPMAMVAGSGKDVARFESRSTTQVHCSPPSFVDLLAAERTLQLNRRSCDAVRARLLALVRRFRRGLSGAGFQLANSLFPVQSLVPDDRVDMPALHRSLTRAGVRAVLHRPACKPGATVSFIINAAHTPAIIDRAVAAIGRAMDANSAAGDPRRAYQ